MKKLLLALATYSAFTAVQLNFTAPAHATIESDSPLKAVESKEYRYDKPFVPSASLESKTTDTVNSQRDEIQSSDGTLHQDANILETGKHTQHLGINKSSSDIVVSSINEFWIYESWVSLEQDIDYDGYHSTFSIEFDADTIFTRAPVYAVLYLGRNDVYEAIHVTSDFYIYSEDSTDTFTIESNLLSGYAPGDYDILLELYDADTEMLVAYTDAYDDSALAYVPLESENYEHVVEETVVVVEEHGGTWTFLTLVLLGGVAFMRRLSVRSQI